MIALTLVAGWLVLSAVTARMLVARMYAEHIRYYSYDYSETVHIDVVMSMIIGLIFWPLVLPVMIAWNLIMAFLVPVEAQAHDKERSS